MEQKIQEILPEDIWNEEKNKAIMQFILEKIQKELDEFAIGFAYWCEWRDDRAFKTYNELLEIYKKEKGL